MNVAFVFMTQQVISLKDINLLSFDFGNVFFMAASTKSGNP